ncbi:MAG: pectate lyase-like adhesive domain-containing protein [Candidatus Sericytochromatia bacterium]
MQHTGSLFTGLTALSLSLGLLAGCAAPAAVTPTSGAAPVAAPAATPEAVAPVAVPTMPAPAAVVPVTLTGTATFRGEPVAGYAVTVLDATTGQPVALRDDLTGATGLAVLNRNLKTDAQGKFSLQVVGLAAGKALRVQVSSGNGRLESILTANGQSMGAKGYRLAQAETAFTVTELTTAIAKVAGNVIRTTQLISAAEAAPLLAKLALEMASLTTKLEKTLSANPNAANDLVSVNGKTADDTLKSLITNAGALRELTQSIAALVADVAKAMGTDPSPAASDAGVRDALANIQFTGTVLVGNMKPNGIQLSNGLNGQSVDANGGNLSTVTSQVTTSSGSGTAAPARDPNGVDVGSYQALLDAISNTTASTIYLTANLNAGDRNAYRILRPFDQVIVNRSVIIDGQDHSLTCDEVLVTTGATVKNLRLEGRLEAQPTHTATYRVAEAAQGMVFDTVKFVESIKGAQLNIGAVQVPVTVKGCVFGEVNSFYKAIQIGSGGQPVTITGSKFLNGTTAIEIGAGSSNVTISGNTFTGADTSSVGIHFNYTNMLQTDPTVDLRATFKSGNTFDGTWANDDAKVKGPMIFPIPVIITI